MTLMDYLYVLSMKYAVGQLKKKQLTNSLDPSFAQHYFSPCVCMCVWKKKNKFYYAYLFASQQYIILYGT